MVKCSGSGQVIPCHALLQGSTVKCRLFGSRNSGRDAKKDKFFIEITIRYDGGNSKEGQWEMPQKWAISNNVSIYRQLPFTSMT